MLFYLLFSIILHFLALNLTSLSCIPHSTYYFFFLSSSYVLLVQTPNFSFRPRLERTPSINFITRIYFSTSSPFLFFLLHRFRFLSLLQDIEFFFFISFCTFGVYRDIQNCSYKGWKVYMHTAYSTHIRPRMVEGIYPFSDGNSYSHTHTNERMNTKKKLLRREIPNRRKQQQHQRKIRGEWEESKNKKT